MDDRSFVHDLVGDDPEAPIIDAIIVMAHALGMTVVAEGVETTDQIAYLRARGCDEAQGFHFSRGVAVSEVVPTVQAIGGPLLSRLRAQEPVRETVTWRWCSHIAVEVTASPSHAGKAHDGDSTAVPSVSCVVRMSITPFQRVRRAGALLVAPHIHRNCSGPEPLICRDSGPTWCPRGDLNPHALIRALAPQASASANSATRTSAERD